MDTTYLIRRRFEGMRIDVVYSSNRCPTKAPRPFMFPRACSCEPTRIFGR